MCELLSEEYSVNLLKLWELVACLQEKGHRCAFGGKARELAGGDGVWVPLLLLGDFSGQGGILFNIAHGQCRPIARTVRVLAMTTQPSLFSYVLMVFYCK